MNKTDIYHIQVATDRDADIVAPTVSGLPSYSFGVGNAYVVVERPGDSPAPTIPDAVAGRVIGMQKVMTVEEPDDNTDDTNPES